MLSKVLIQMTFKPFESISYISYYQIMTYNKFEKYL